MSEPAIAPVEPVGDLDLSNLDLKAKQAVYHDYEAQTYEDKFKISYDEHVIAYARERFVKAIPEGRVEGRVLELGSGTGFFTISLALGECIAGELHCSDISEGMLRVCKVNGAEHGLELHTRQGDAEDLPYDDDTFDLVIGHAFIHHLPVPGKAFQEAHRVLKPGGRLVIAGEPTFWGDRISHVVKRNVYRGFKAVTSLPGLQDIRKPELRDSADDAELLMAALEHEVDLHTFRPDEVERMASIAGFTDVSVVTEELLGNWWGWGIRTLEGAARPGTFGMRWAMTAFRGYRLFTAIDETVMQRFVPRSLFYNLIVTGTKPSS
jgi:ubiquinone/menaquinone biosynthesis C-methylase UbiE